MLSETLSRVEVFENGGFRPFSLLRLRRKSSVFDRISVGTEEEKVKKKGMRFKTKEH